MSKTHSPNDMANGQSSSGQNREGMPNRLPPGDIPNGQLPSGQSVNQKIIQIYLHKISKSIN